MNSFSRHRRRSRAARGRLARRTARFTLVLVPVLVSVLGLMPAAACGQVAINELMSSNFDTLLDEDGQASDWIEIYNGGSIPVDLDGYGLSDDDVPLKWQFPPVVLAPGGMLVVFASGKNRLGTAAHWETVIDWGDEWRFVVPASEPPPAWRSPGFDDGAWTRGRTGIGYGDGDDRTTVPRGTISVYARKTFQVDDPAQVTHVFFDIDFDDAFVAFLNGVEIARENIRDQGRPPTFQETADGFTEPRMTSGGRPVHYEIADPAGLLRSGENVLAVQVHNHSSGSSDLTMIPFLTLGMTAVPPGARGVPDLLRPNLPALHTNFKIDDDGEPITLASPEGEILDFVLAGAMPAGISMGRFPDGDGGFGFHDDPTPGRPNGTPGFTAIGGPVLFSEPGGMMPAPFTLTLSAEDPAGAIHFTLDGSEPTASSPRYDTPITIDVTTVVRARVLADGAVPGPTATRTYIVGETSELPVVSISTDPANFFDDDIGIYVFGPTYESRFPHFGANFWEDWERPVHVELFEPDGSLGFSLDLGAKIFGGWSRGHPQRSLSFFARKKYGPGKIRYRIFAKKKIKTFESFILRNSGNDWQNTHFRDGMLTSLLDDLPVDRQAYRPAAVYINGDYWGLMNLREKISEHFVASNHPGVKPEEVDLLERDGRAIEGDADHYRQLISLVSNGNVSDPAVYEQVRSMMDIENFIDYQASQIYFDNTDWPGNNIKFWRDRAGDGRWRWIMFDTDFGFGIWNVDNYRNDTLGFALEPNGPGWPNPPWSTLLLRRLVTNGEFVEDFVNRFATHLNTIFQPSKVIARINEMAAAIESEIPAQKRRWGGSVSDWRARVQNMRTFASSRLTFMRTHLRSRFGLGSPATLRLTVSPAGGGAVAIQGIEVGGFPWSGVYFRDIPIRLTAVPRPGYRFAGWSGVSPAGEPEASLVLTASRVEVGATFEIDCEAAGTVVINEISYNAPVDADPGDWVEIHNRASTPLDLGGWTLRDESDGHVFAIPAGTSLAARGYLVLCADSVAFEALHPGVTDHIGDLGFGLDGDGDTVRLFDAAGTLVDSVAYGDAAPWPEEPDGAGATLALRNPVLDNSYAPHWAASSSGGGTPGARNDVFEEVESDCVGGSVRFLRGDCNGDGSADISDARCILTWLFGGRSVSCLASLDVDGSAALDISDAISLLEFLFLAGPPPVEPFPSCGWIGDDDALGCQSAPGSCR